MIKKFLNFILVICLILPSMLCLNACFNGGHIKKDLTIKNFQNYESIAVGVVNQTSPAPIINGALAITTNTASQRNSTSKAHLIGKNKNGYYEQIQFEQDSEFSDIYNVSAIQQLGNFMFINYCKNYKGEISNHINNHTRDYAFVMDLKNGKMFDITEEFINIYTRGVYCVNDSAFYTHNNYKLYKYSIENSLLKKEELIDTSKVSSFRSPYMVDRYGNVFSGTEFNSTHYIYTTTGELKRLNFNVKMGMNNIVYTDDNQWFNSEGNLENAGFVPNDFTSIQMHYQHEFLIYKNENTYYYRITDGITDNYKKIFKYEFINDIEYNVEIIQMEKYENNTGVIVNDRIYFLNSDEIYYVNIVDGSYKNINSNYFFNKIYTNNYGEVIFEGVDNYLNDIIGVIGNDDSVTIGITPKEFEIYYIAPIN